MSDADDDRDRLVFDCNVFVQALLSENGPAAACVNLALERTVRVFISLYLLDELRTMPTRPTPRRLGLTEARVDSAIEKLIRSCTFVAAVPERFIHPVDEKDSHYVNLALTADAKLIVSRDKHLLNLTNPAKPWSADFRRRFPAMRVMRPDDYLRERINDR